MGLHRQRCIQAINIGDNIANICFINFGVFYKNVCTFSTNVNAGRSEDKTHGMQDVGVCEFTTEF